MAKTRYERNRELNERRRQRGIFFCKYCGKAFSTLASTGQHERLTHRKKMASLQCNFKYFSPVLSEKSSSNPKFLHDHTMSYANTHEDVNNNETTVDGQKGGRFRLVPINSYKIMTHQRRNTPSLDDEIRKVIHNNKLCLSEKLKLYQQALSIPKFEQDSLMFNNNTIRTSNFNCTTPSAENGGKYKLANGDSYQIVNHRNTSSLSLDDEIRKLVQNCNIDPHEKVKLYRQVLLN